MQNSPDICAIEFMNPERSKLKQHEASHEQSQNVASQSGREFGSVEELLRHDAANTVPPAGLAARVNASVAVEPKPAGSWWKKLFSR